MRHDLLRFALCVLLLGALAAWGLPFWLFLTLPLVAYGGLWLLVATPEIDARRVQPLRAAGEDTTYRACLDLRSHVQTLSGQVTDSGVASQLSAVFACVDKSLDAIAEDGKYAAAMPLSDLLGYTDKLLGAYVKVVRRGFADPELHGHVRERLGTIERACKRFWDRLNRDAVVDLRALSETIDVLFEADGQPFTEGAATHLPGTTPDVLVGAGPRGDLAASVAVDAPGEAVSSPSRSNLPILKLTPREREILCLLPTGKTDQEIAAEQFISPRTVSKHVETVYGKLGVRNRAEAVAFAVRHGLCENDSAAEST